MLPQNTSLEGLPLPLALAAFGLLWGSFLNVCIYRLPRHRSVVRPRSLCPGCHRPIRWYDNIPLLSFLVLRGRCRDCGRHISWRYPVVEASTAVLFYLTAAQWQFSPETLKWMIFLSLLIVLFWTDYQTRRLPDTVTLGGTILGLALAPLLPPMDGTGAFLFPHAPLPWQAEASALAGAVLLTVPFVAVVFSYAALRQISPPGWGDVKLLVVLGAFLGVQAGLVALFLGGISGTIIGLGYILGKRQPLSRYRLPFGTFLCVGAAAAVFWGPEIFSVWWNRTL
jgi:leader peptidase (prepilin peptidase) / N-methyltransferase